MHENKPFPRFQKAWQDAAVMLLNTFVLFVVVNFAIGFGCNFDPGASVSKIATVVETVARSQGRPTSGRYRSEWQIQHIDMDAFEGVNVADVYQMLDDMTKMSVGGVTYVPWVEYSIPEFHSNTVNNDQDRSHPEFYSRRSVLDPALAGDANRPVIDVYLFGGSTAWGWDTADSWTVGSYLWNALQERLQKDNPGARIRLVNYGRPLNYSSQEVALYSRLLQAGHRPQVVVFLDGMNDCIQLATLKDQPFFTPKLTRLLHDDQFGVRKNFLEEYQWIPIVRMAYYLRLRFAKPVAPSGGPAEAAAPIPADQSTAFVLNAYRANRTLARQLSEANGVRSYFVWQPGPFYAYDTTLHRNWSVPMPETTETFRQVYQAMKVDRQCVYLGDLCQEWGHRKAFVDDVHYNPGFSKFLAGHIASHMDLTGLTPHPATP